MPNFSRKDFWKDVFICSVVDYAASYGIGASSAALLASGNPELAIAIFFSPISYQGIARAPYVYKRIKQEMGMLREAGISSGDMEKYKKFYRAVFAINFIRFPPLPMMPVQLDNFTGVLLTFPRGGKLSSLHLDRTIQESRRTPAFIKKIVGKTLEWATKKLP